MLKLRPVEQSVYCGNIDAVFYAVPGGRGAKGATFVNLKAVKQTVLAEALQTAYGGVMQKNKMLPVSRWAYSVGTFCIWKMPGLPKSQTEHGSGASASIEKLLSERI